MSMTGKYAMTGCCGSLRCTHAWPCKWLFGAHWRALTLIADICVFDELILCSGAQTGYKSSSRSALGDETTEEIMAGHSDDVCIVSLVHGN